MSKIFPQPKHLCPLLTTRNLQTLQGQAQAKGKVTRLGESSLTILEVVRLAILLRRSGPLNVHVRLEVERGRPPGLEVQEVVIEQSESPSTGTKRFTLLLGTYSQLLHYSR